METSTDLTTITGIGESTAAMLREHGFATVADLAQASLETLSAVPGFGPTRAAVVRTSALALLSNEPPQPEPPPAKEGDSMKDEKDEKKKDKDDGKEKKDGKKKKGRKKDGKKKKDGKDKKGKKKKGKKKKGKKKGKK